MFNKIRIGNGFDIHKITTGNFIKLGGIKIPYKYGLLGHSDADVLTHAIIDSVLGALCLNDIGTWFPSSMTKYKNIDSIILLKEVLNNKLVKLWHLTNLDATVIIDNLKLASYIIKIKQNLSKILNSTNISIKAKTTENILFCNTKQTGFIMVIANILLYKE